MTYAISAGPESLADRAAVDAISYCEARHTDDTMDAEIAAAKNKRGIIAKFKSRIAPVAQSNELPEMDESWGLYLVASIAINQMTWERLTRIAESHGVTL